MTMALIKLEGVSKFYKTLEGVSTGMRDVNLSFDTNEFVAITGESGSGKSTLLNVISGFDGYEEGEIYVSGNETSHFAVADWEMYRRKYIGFIFQNYNIIDSYTVFQNVMLALEIQNYPVEERKKRALELIDRVGLSSHKNHKASKLSGGQKQRTVIARALAKDCPVIVADEPTGNLDSESSNRIIELLHDVSKDKLVIIVTHNYEEVERFATRKIKMHDGEVTEDLLLKKTVASENIIKKTSFKIGFLSILRLALRNTFATPKRFVFFLLLHLLVAFAFMTTYANMNNQIARAINQDSMFSYGGILERFRLSTDYLPENRMIVMRKDGNFLDESDFDKLNSLSANKHIEMNNHFLDKFSYSIISTNKDALTSNLKFDTDTYMSQSLKDKNKDIITLNNQKIYPIIVSENTGLLIDDRISIEKPKQALVDGIFQETPVLYQFKVVGIYSGTTEYKLYISSDVLNDIDSALYGITATITLRTFGEAVNYRKLVDTTQYRLYFPADQASSASVFRMLSFILNIFFYIVTFVVGIFLYLVLHAVTKNLMASRKKDFAIYRSIGANQRMLSFLVVLEQIILYMFATSLLMILVLLLNEHVDVFRSIIAFLKPQDFVIVLVVLLLFTIWLGLRFNKKVFNFSVIETLSQSKEDLL